MAGTPLGPLLPSQTYPQLLNLNSSGIGLVADYTVVQDGAGNLTNLSLSTAGLKIDRLGGKEFLIDNTPLTASVENLNNISDLMTANVFALIPNDGFPGAIVLTAGLGLGLFGSGQAMNFAVTGNLAAIFALTGAGILAQTATGAYELRTLTHDTTITIANPAGTAGNPLLGVVDDTNIQKVYVQANSGSSVGPRSILNFIGSDNLSVSAADDGGDNRVNVTLDVANPWKVATAVTVGLESVFIVSIPVAEGTAVAITGIISAISADGVPSMAAQFSGGAYRIPFGSTTVYDQTSVNTFVESFPNDSDLKYINIAAFGSSMVVAVSGLAGDNINWKCSYHYIVQEI